MKKSDMAFVVPVKGLGENKAGLDLYVWSQVTKILEPTLGKTCGRFEPAEVAWKQSIRNPFGIVYGRSDPALFLYFYAYGKSKQEDAISHHLKGILDKCDVEDKFEEDNIIGISVNPQKGQEDEVAAHLFWHTGMMAGEIFPDAGIYYVSARQSCVSSALDEEILKNIADYAIVMVRFYAEAGNA